VQEEECVFARHYSDAVRAMIDRALEDHAAMRRLADRFEQGEGSIVLVREFGELLERHIRFEERELFPAVQNETDENGMNEIGAEISSRRAGPSLRSE
jgi:hemerythrin-like domain-containing protein